MDRRILAAVAVIVSVVSVFGFVSISEESDGAGSVYTGSVPYESGTVLDFTTATDDFRYTFKVDTRLDFAFIIPVVFPDDFEPSVGFSSVSSNFSGFEVGVNYTDDSIIIFGQTLSLNSITGYFGVDVGDHKLIVSIVATKSALYVSNNSSANWTSSSADAGDGFVAGQSFVYVFDNPREYDFCVPVSFRNSVYADDFVTLSEDGNSISGTAPDLISEDGCDKYMFIFGFDDSYSADLVLFVVGPDHYETVVTNPVITLVRGEPVEEVEVFEVVRSSTFVWDYELPDGLHFGKRSNSYRLSYFDVWGTPSVSGSFDVVISGSDKFTGASVNPVTVTFNILDEWTVVFHSEDGSVIHEVTALTGELVSSIPVDPVKEGMEVSGWFKDSDLTEPFNPRYDAVTSDLMLYPGFSVPEPEPEPEPPVSDGVVSPDSSGDDSRSLLLIFGGILTVAALAIVGVRRR